MNARPRDPGQIAPQLGPAPAPEAVPLPPLTNNSWSVLFEIKDEGPPNGLTLEQAMNRLVSATIALRAKSLDIPQADADVLTAGLHANPVVYADGQLVPYKHYSSASNPGGPTEYDLNVAYRRSPGCWTRRREGSLRSCRHRASDSPVFTRLATAPCPRLPMPEVWLWVSGGPASPRSVGLVVAHHKPVPRRMVSAGPSGSPVLIAVPLLPCNTESKTSKLTASRDFE
jgi:hypothetical protein